MTETPSAPVVIVGGGQSGLSAARAVQEAGLEAVVLEAGERPVGSWPGYYDSLTLFSPAGYSAMPGLRFPAEPDAYPRRDDVVGYLERYAKTLEAEIRVGCRVESIERDGRGFVVNTDSAGAVHASGVVAASGSFGNPYLPELPGRSRFTGETLHAAAYRNPAGLAGKRVVVVGGGNSAVQIAYELAKAADVTLATRRPLAFIEQRRDGEDLHHWLRVSGYDDLPSDWLDPFPVLDDGVYQEALESGLMSSREMFSAFDADGVVWSDGSRERVDAVLFATGYRPDVGYLRRLGALDAAGAPLHSGGISTTCPGLVYVGLELQRSFSSNTLRGARRDARHVVAALAAHVRDAPTAIGL